MVSEDTPNFDSLWDYSNPRQTEAKFRELLVKIPHDDPARLELLTQIARAQGLQHNFDDAHKTLDEVGGQISKYASPTKVRYFLERGRVYNSSGHADQARPFFEQAETMAAEIQEDFHAVDAVHMLAIVSPPDQNLTLNLRAIKMAESSGQEKARNWLGSLYNNTGWSYHDRGDYESALEMFQAAETFQSSKGRVNETRIAKWTVARTLRSMNRVEEALSNQMELKKEIELTGEEDGFVYGEIGECLLALHRPVEAQPFFAKAHKILSQDTGLVEQETRRLERLKELGKAG